MFNLLISSRPDSWDSGSYKFDRNRVAIEYTAEEISERYKSFDEKTIDELKSFPALFVIEGESRESRIGHLTEIKIRENGEVFIRFQFDPNLPPLSEGTLENLIIDLDIGRWELGRTHWAIKDEPLFDVLIRRKYISQQQFEASRFATDPTPAPIKSISGELDTTQVFIVHGHDEIAKLEMKDFVEDLGLVPIILHLQASAGQTIIEKIEHYSNVGFAIILYTPCDIGTKVGNLLYAYRARQNVVFEHGYLIGKLGRPRVCPIVKGPVETPNDISGVVYVPMDELQAWKEVLTNELRRAGYQV